MNLTEVRHSLLIMSVLIGISLPMSVFAGSLVGKQRFDITTGAEIITRVLTTIAVYVVLRAGGGLVALALIQAGGRIVYWVLTLSACSSVLGGLFVRSEWFKMERVRDLAGYGLRNAVGHLATLVIYRMDLTVVGMFAGIEWVTYYSIGGHVGRVCVSALHKLYFRLHSAVHAPPVRQRYRRAAPTLLVRNARYRDGGHRCRGRDAGFREGFYPVMAGCVLRKRAVDEPKRHHHGHLDPGEPAPMLQAFQSSVCLGWGGCAS